MPPRNDTRVTSFSDVALLGQSFKRSLEAANKAPRTVETYMEAVRGLEKFLEASGMPTDVTALTREHIEAYVTYLLANWKPATASNRFRALQQFFKWLAEEGEIEDSPMQRMKPPRVPEQTVPVLSEDDLKKLLRTCNGNDLPQRRDKAILMLLLDTGMRRSEIAGLTLEDLDLDNNVALVMGKGRRPRACPFGRRTALALDRYIRVRMKHRDSHLPALWLGHSGPMTPNGIYQVVRDRAREAGLDGIHPHQFRHTFAHVWLINDGNETDLMRLTGWQSRSMLSRYGASAADERAREAYKKLSPGDRL